MAQPPILLEPDKTYHIWTHANGNENLFRIDENYRYFLEKYTQHMFPVVETFAYCLMPNHLHLMVRIRPESELLTLPGFKTLEGLEVSKGVSRKFSNLFNGYTQAYNKMFDRRGSLFMDSFKRKVIESDSYFSALIAYIHNNPIHHGFVKNLNDWPHSSWHSYMVENKITRISRDEGIAWFGNKNNFIKFHQELVKTDEILEFE